jgi:transcription elongation factor GreA
MQRVPMTPTGHQQLSAELKYLKETKRHEIVRDIEEAIAHGDLSENSEYDDAKERQSLCEGRIMDLEAKLAACEIIDVTSLAQDQRVVFGVTVVLQEDDSDEPVAYRIVGEDEASPREGSVSVTSPIARALIGKEVDDEVEVRAPGGTKRYVITEVLYR